MGKTPIIFITSVIPSHTGCPRARQAFLYWRILRCLADVKILVFDGGASQFAYRVKLCRNTSWVPLTQAAKQVLQTRDAGLIQLGARDANQIQEKIAELGVEVKSAKFFAEDGFLAAFLKSAVPAARHIISMPSRFLRLAKQDDSYQKLVESIFASGTSETAEYLTVILSGEEALDRQVCEQVTKSAESLRALCGGDLQIRVFGELPLEVTNSGAFESSHWRDLVGVLASSWLVLNFRTIQAEDDLTLALATALGTTLASPMGTSAYCSSSPATRMLEWSCAAEMTSIIRRHFATSRLQPRPMKAADTIPLAKILQGLAKALGFRLSLKSFPKTPSEFLFGDASARRRTSMHREFQIYFVPATSLLSMRTYFSHESGINEIRVMDQHRQELGRVIPTSFRSDLPLQPINGGLILHGSATPPDLLLQFYESGLLCGEKAISSSEIPIVKSELAALDFGGKDYSASSGLVWADNPGEDLEIVLPRDVRHRLNPSDSGTPADRTNKWRAFDVMGSFSPHRGEVVRVLSEDGKSHQRVLRLGSAYIHRRGPANSKIMELKDQHVGRRAWIIGNGPSVQYSDLDLIGQRGDIVFCFNRFHLAYDQTSLREDFVVSADTLMIEDFGHEMIHQSAGLAMFCAEGDQTSGLDGEFVRLNKLDVEMPLFCRDASQFVHVGGSSVFVALQLAYHFGIREVFTYGLDYSFSQTPVFDPKYSMPVCYDEGNHFIKGYRANKPWVPPNWRDISFGFLKARIAFEAVGGRIFNVTRGGKLDIFERLNLDELFAESQ